MAVRPRLSAQPVDMGDVQGLTEEVVQENEELYDLTYNTFLDTFTVPLTAQEVREMITRIDAQMLAALVRSDPDTATEILKTAREGR